ncbi:Aminotransferase [Hondaea fermentalgiana]|uniref:Aminotransferase n=1 Tax=Hondaea fermentalgiana TaxID=2315210 RepID=A0A2R5GN08_9STRA|nr:Aminotransferase [Hondaea fermentalgiana]|eukprot:GBG29691.1 Aminotransferase [Hondaea fermentalgiana]
MRADFWSGEGVVDAADAAVPFAVGQPDAGLLPRAELAAAVQRAAAGVIATTPMAMQYGLSSGPSPWRREVAAFASEYLGVPVSPLEVMATAGTSSALAVLAQSFVRRNVDLHGDAGRDCLVEVPSYFLAEDILRDAGCVNVVGIPRGAEGIVDLIEDELATRARNGLAPPAFIYMVPTFHNPTGAELDQEQMRRLGSLADRYETHCILDEPYNLLTFGNTAVMPHGASLAESARVLSLVSFSKIFAPGLRLGWVQGAPEVLESVFAKAGSVRSGGGVNPVSSMLVTELLRDRAFVDAHLLKLRTELGERMSLLVEGIDEAVSNSPGVDLRLWQRPRGGYFVMLQGPWSDTSSPAFARASEELGLSLVHGNRCVMNVATPASSAVRQELETMMARCASSVRLSVAMTSRPQIERGIRALCELARKKL